jgi:hypothetical protein
MLSVDFFRLYLLYIQGDIFEIYFISRVLIIMFNNLSYLDMFRRVGEGICGVDDGREREEGDGTADSRVRDRSHEAQHHSTRSVCITRLFCSPEN